MAWLSDIGCLANWDTGSVHQVDPGIIADIEEWAVENGY
jgi:hypothetical protein